MEVNSYDSLIKAIANKSVDEPCLILISGKDTLIFPYISDYIEKTIIKNKEVELNILTGEIEDFSKFVNDLYNYSLFVPNRLYILKQAHIVFKNTKGFIFKEIPPKTWILIEYDDVPPVKLFKNVEKYLIHYPTKLLYENQIENFIKQLSKKYNLVFSEEAIQEIKYLIPPRESSLRTIIYNIYLYFKNTNKEDEYHVTYETIRNFFYPSGGWDMFKIIDALFARDLNMFLIEIEKYNPPEDSYFVLLKNLLNKVDEFRKYLIAVQMNMNNKEILQLLGLEKKHPVVQKKILSQFEYSQKVLNFQQIKKIYNFLVDISFAFRQNVDESNRKTIFVKKAMEVFFNEFI